MHSCNSCHHHKHHHHGEHASHHTHGHAHPMPSSGGKLLLVTLLNTLITVVEIVGGLWSNSLSLLSDAIHNLGDTLAVAFAYVAQKISRKRADARHTFGYSRVEILAAFVNAAVLIVICLFLLKEAYERWVHPEPIQGGLMLIVATVGLLANLLSVVLLQREKEHNMNTRAAYLHLLGDTLSSVAVILGGVAIWIWNIMWIDPLITVGVSLYIIKHTWHILKEAVTILMQMTPLHINVHHVKEEIEQLSEVENLHHLHIWQLNDKQIHLEAHLNLSQDFHLSQLHALHQRIERFLLDKYGINHVTLQMEYMRCRGQEQLISCS